MNFGFGGKSLNFLENLLVNEAIDYNPDIITIKLPNNFMYEFDSYNNQFVNNQIEFIDKTLNIIKNKDSVNLDEIIQEQIKNAKEWCITYNFK